MGARRDVSVGERERAERRRPSSASRQSPSSDQTGAGILELQRTAGNRAAYRLATQAKLLVDPAGNHFQRETDRVADEVMRSLTSTTVASDDGRTRACRSVDDGVVGVEGDPLGSDTESGIARSRGGGSRLPEGLRRSMEGAFDADFAGVQVHTGPSAAGLNRAMQARAFTVGHAIYFARDQYQPRSTVGQRPLAHELTHALQHAPRLPTAVQRDLDTTALQELVDLEKEPPVANKLNSDRAAALLKKSPSADEKNRIIAIRKVFAGGKAASPPAALTTSTTSPPSPTTTTTAPAPVPTPYVPDPAFLNASHPIVGRIRVKVPTVDDRIIENIERLSQSTTVAGGSYYSTFFTEVDSLLTDVPAAAWVTFSGASQNLAGLFKSLALQYKNDKSVGGYKGMASEILAALRNAALAEEPTVRIPKDYKPISSAFATTKDKTKNTKTATAAPIATPAPRVMVQDVDRTDLFKVSGDKFYVEVKADSHTAVQKHHNYLVPQLKRYLEVIQTINDNYTQVLSKPDPLSAKEQKMKAKTDPRTRMPAIEITDPTGWLELFQPGGVRASAPSGGTAPAPPATRSTAAMYSSNGFWLFIGGQRFSPVELGRIDGHVQAHIASINPTKFLAPAAFAAGATPDLAACY